MRTQRKVAAVFVVVAAVAAWFGGGRVAYAVSCGTEGAILEIVVHNPAGSSVHTEVSLTGAIVTGGASCTNFASSYSVTTGQELYPGDNRVLVTNLNSGLWRHVVSVSYGANEYNQYQRGVVIKAAPDDPNDPNDPNDPDRPFSRVDWMYYANSIEVDEEGDAAGGDCSSNCTFRNALAEVNSLSTSVSNRALIFFTKSPGEMEQGDELLIEKPYVTIDGTNSLGLPWIVGDTIAEEDSFPTSIDLMNENSIVVDSGVAGTLIKGLAIANFTDGEMPMWALIEDYGVDTRIEATRLDGGTADYLDCNVHYLDECWNGHLAYADSSSEASPTFDNVIGTGSFGVAVLGYAASVNDSRFQHNLGGNFAVSRLNLTRSLVERAGINTSDDIVSNSAMGIGSDFEGNIIATLATNSNIIRNNATDGINVIALNLPPDIDGVDLQHDFVCGNSDVGIALTLLHHEISFPQGTGLASVYNIVGMEFTGSHGGTAAFDDDSAFTANLSYGLVNASTGGVISALNNQWRDIPDGDCSSGSTEIDGSDIYCHPAQSWLDAPIVLDPNQSVAPTNARLVGQIVRVQGVGFNAIHGNPVRNDLPNQEHEACTLGPLGGEENCCRMIDRANLCAGTPPTAVADAGNCVAIRSKEAGAGSSDTWAVAELEGITPTTLTFGLPAPISCIGELGELVRVSKRDGDGIALVEEVAYCNNATPKQ